MKKLILTIIAIILILIFVGILWNMFLLKEPRMNFDVNIEKEGDYSLIFMNNGYEDTKARIGIVHIYSSCEFSLEHSYPGCKLEQDSPFQIFITCDTLPYKSLILILCKSEEEETSFVYTYNSPLYSIQKNYVCSKSCEVTMNTTTTHFGVLLAKSLKLYEGLIPLKD